MKTSDVVQQEKLRGGFYSPQSLVRLALDRAQLLLGATTNVRVLEPSSGSGAFIQGLAQHSLASKISSLQAVELLDSEAARSEEALARGGFQGRVSRGSVLRDPVVQRGGFDLAVGNPPFVRFQFIDDESRAAISDVASDLGVEFGGVSNLWIPVFLRALGSLRDGGTFSFILPSECFTGISGRVVRDWLIVNTAQMNIDLFGARSFPGVLQEVVVLSGRIERESGPSCKLVVLDRVSDEEWSHQANTGNSTWMRYLLRPEHLDAFDFALAVPSVQRLGEVVRFGVSTVTGANGFFCMTDATRTQNGLEAWTRPLLSRARHAPGIVLTHEDMKNNKQSSKVVWMLDTSGAARSEPSNDALARYIVQGETVELHTRYKCRVRKPWYRVPVVEPRDLLLSKRSNTMPRVIVNQAHALTTDTVYQGRLVGDALPEDVAGSFHNSLTLLAAELHGRSFGGGVFELVPSEIASLVVPVMNVDTDFLHDLDFLSRSGHERQLVNITDQRLAKTHPELDRHVMGLLDEARMLLVARRMARTTSSQLAPQIPQT